MSNPARNATRGSSTSAAKVGFKSGVRGPRSGVVWIGGREQRWVRWSEIYLQVEEAYRAWRMKKALRGVRIFDASERIDAGIRDAIAARNSRK